MNQKGEETQKKKKDIVAKQARTVQISLILSVVGAGLRGAFFWRGAGRIWRQRIHCLDGVFVAILFRLFWGPGSLGNFAIRGSNLLAANFL